MKVILLAAFSLVPVAAGSVAAQSPVLSVDPPCPLSFPGANKNGFSDIRVVYDPHNPHASIKQPQALTLEVALDPSSSQIDTLSIPFIRKESGMWEAVLAREEKDEWLHVIFMVKDQKTAQVDDNSGNYWDLIFCFGNDQLNSQAVSYQARSFEGIEFRNGIRRSQDLPKAKDVLEGYLKRENWPERYNLLRDYWNYKIRITGPNEENWKKLGDEINQFVEEHRSEESALIGAADFVGSQEANLHQGLLPKVMEALRALNPRLAAQTELFHAYNRIRREKDPLKRATEYREFAMTHPKESLAQSALAEQFRVFYDKGDVQGTEEAFRQWVKSDPDWPDTYAAMASFYITQNVKLNEALKLLDTAESLLPKSRTLPSIGRYFVLRRDPTRDQLELTYWRARALLLQGKLELAFPLASTLATSTDDSGDYFIAGQIFEATEHLSQALDAYLQAAILPSPKHTERLERLKRFWSKNGLGPDEQLQQRLKVKEREDFKKSNYVPLLVDVAVPEFEFLTLSGERMRSTDWKEKTVVLNFWSTWCAPCVPELSGFQELQAKHPDVLVATIVDGKDDETLQKLIHDQKLDALRIAPSGEERFRFGIWAVPTTHVIDHGRIRVIHIGSLKEVVPTIEADLAALKAW
jgi:thiol-disulfide isomerase/thioredoxin